MPGGKKLVRGRCGGLPQPLQDVLDLLVAGRYLRLINVGEFQRLCQGEDVFLPIVANQRLTHRLDSRVTPSIAMRGQHGRVVLSGDDCADNRHAGHAGDVGYDMMQLQVHLHQSLLHVLDMRRCVIQQPLPLA